VAPPLAGPARSGVGDSGVAPRGRGTACGGPVPAYGSNVVCKPPIRRQENLIVCCIRVEHCLQPLHAPSLTALNLAPYRSKVVCPHCLHLHDLLVLRHIRLSSFITSISSRLLGLCPLWPRLSVNIDISSLDTRVLFNKRVGKQPRPPFELVWNTGHDVRELSLERCWNTRAPCVKKRLYSLCPS
jgi:hypothetical protein